MVPKNSQMKMSMFDTDHNLSEGRRAPTLSDQYFHERAVGGGFRFVPPNY
ncbi:hypothetical protein JCM12141A_62040 [Mycolicibacterium hodleri]